MRFLFFNAAGAVLFERDDAESASVTHEEMSFQALFPFDKAKEILRGMRIGYQDSTGTWQAYEIRKVRTLEPDHMQEIGAENIAISELTDEFCEKAEITNKTVAQVLNSTDGLLTGTGWAIGTNTTSNTSSCDISTGDVWNATRTVQQNWNCYIIPRITVGSAGITGKYLDVMPAGGTWRGVRLSLDKNLNEAGVIWDDSKLKTALYAFGQEKNGTALTFKDVVWTATSGHPAKPANQTYLEDPTATAAYGRNGRPRFGYYQNASITDATTLLEKTWEVLQTVNVPDVTVNATVSDLHRLGYVDVPLRLHDTALIEIRPTGVVLQKEIIQYTEDLLNPLNSRLTIGTYIPNIIYINREANKRGGGGGRGSGDSQDPLEYTIENNTVQISIDSNGLNSLCVGTGAQLNPDGSLVVDPVTGKPVFIATGDTMWSQITQNKENITLKVSKGDVATQLTVEVGNVSISGGNLVVDGYVTSAGLQSEIAALGYVECSTMIADTFGDGSGVVDVGSVTAEGTISCDSLYANEIDLGGDTFTNCIISASVSGNVLTLTPLSGNAVTFSKATALSGGWNSGTFTVDATQNNVNVGSYTTTITQGTTSWSADGLTATIPIVATDTGSGGQSYATGRSVYAYAPFQLATVTLQGSSTPAYIEDLSGSGDTYYLPGSQVRKQGSSVSRKTTGYLYDYSGNPIGYGSWFLDSNLNTTTLYTQGSLITPIGSTSITVKAKTLYNQGTTDSSTYYTKT